MFKSLTAIFLLVLASLAALNTSEALKYQICAKNTSAAEIKDVRVNDCESQVDSCSFLRGFNKSIEIDFVAKQKIEQVKVKIAGKLSGLPMPFSVKPDEACGNYGFNCPLEAGKAYKFALTLPVLRTYPKLNVEVILHLLDEKGAYVGCIELPARIQEPPKDK